MKLDKRSALQIFIYAAAPATFVAGWLLARFAIGHMRG
jgi:hypothetical protein